MPARGVDAHGVSTVEISEAEAPARVGGSSRIYKLHRHGTYW
jgi:hypothetical protein